MMMMIKRRKFCRYIALSSACLAGALEKKLALSTTAKFSPTKSFHNWVVLYWMPYDNDLVRFGEPIIKMLTRGTQNSEVAVVVQSDYWGDKKMRRRLLVKGTTKEINIQGEDSSDVSAFSAYLDWAKENFEAKNWAIIIVGHGGRINEVSPDDHRATNQTRTWMRVDQLTNVLSNFNQGVNGRVELLFWQNCNKATLEVMYQARNCAKYTLASQLLLGAPNYYYEGFLNRLQEPSVGGREAAIAIMDSERADMYHTLTLVDNEEVKLIPEKLSRLLRLILNNNLLSVRQSELSTFRYFGEQCCDALVFLGYLSSLNKKGYLEFTEFANFLRHRVITFHKIGGEFYGTSRHNNTKLEGLCGLSLYLPETQKDTSRYSSLALYQKVDLVNLYRRIVNI
ncbi:clostripain-related cysteine peptidase [Okeania sp. KiyG1]|uniref:clostripain-related cysteine peptidase n=1 Tax=Okeania sp. KiyG1 TaxID=2720165 RepID=UPI00199F3316|nr:clostripain-related cysteine peptidase [Okeania sp. KiyG1]GGA17509.1 hypothetical protein CYANOKiyG1_31760 [Okeania sp. KiyG1]